MDNILIVGLFIIILQLINILLVINSQPIKKQEQKQEKKNWSFPTLPILNKEPKEPKEEIEDIDTTLNDIYDVIWGRTPKKGGGK